MKGGHPSFPLSPPPASRRTRRGTPLPPRSRRVGAGEALRREEERQGRGLLQEGACGPRSSRFSNLERARRPRGGRKFAAPTSAPGGPRRPGGEEAAGSGAERGAAGARSLRPAPATRAGDPGALAGMDSTAAAAFALDKPPLGPGPPPPPPALGPGDCAQARKNFTVSHLLDLEEVAAAGRLAARPAARAEAREGAAREPSGGSSGSEAAPQDGECGRRAGPRRGAGARGRGNGSTGSAGSAAGGGPGPGGGWGVGARNRGAGADAAPDPLRVRLPGRPRRRSGWWRASVCGRVGCGHQGSGPGEGPGRLWPEPPPPVVGRAGRWVAFVPGPGAALAAALPHRLGSGCDYRHGPARETEASGGQSLRVTKLGSELCPLPPIPPQLLLGLKRGSLARRRMPAPHLPFAPLAASSVEWPKPKEPARPLSSAEVKGHQERALKTNNPPKWLFFFFRKSHWIIGA